MDAAILSMPRSGTTMLAGLMTHEDHVMLNEPRLFRPKRWRRHASKMEFKRFADSLLRVPCQIVRTGRRIVYRLLSWNPWTGVLLRLADQVRLPLRC